MANFPVSAGQSALSTSQASTRNRKGNNFETTEFSNHVSSVHLQLLAPIPGRVG
jgi:hypothetical protein